MKLLFLNLRDGNINHASSNKQQLSALNAFAKALKVNFETSKSSYNPDFVAKITASKNQVDEGNFTTLDAEKSVWENLR